MVKLKEIFFKVVSPLLKGVAQIMLQNNAWTGLLFLAGIFYGSIAMGLAAILSVCIGTYTAKLLKYNEEQINDGIYGFSATLVGVALSFLFEPTLIVWLFIIIGSALATIVQHFFSVRKVPAFTFPFILVTWVLLFIFHYLALPKSTTEDITLSNNLSVLALGYGQVIFQGSDLSGLLFFIGVLINRPIAAIYGVVAAALGGFIAYQFGESINDIYLGLFGYNAVLCAITFAGRKLGDLTLALIPVVLSVLIMMQMRKIGLPALTFPFVLATWLALLINRKLKLKHT